MQEWESELLDQMVGKLLCHNITPLNFNEENCKRILIECVMGKRLLEVFDVHHNEIFNRLKLSS